MATFKKQQHSGIPPPRSQCYAEDSDLKREDEEKSSSEYSEVKYIYRRQLLDAELKRCATPGSESTSPITSSSDIYPPRYPRFLFVELYQNLMHNLPQPGRLDQRIRNSIDEDETGLIGVFILGLLFPFALFHHTVHKLCRAVATGITYLPSSMQLVRRPLYLATCAILIFLFAAATLFGLFMLSTLLPLPLTLSAIRALYRLAAIAIAHLPSAMRENHGPAYLATGAILVFIFAILSLSARLRPHPEYERPPRRARGLA